MIKIESVLRVVRIHQHAKFEAIPSCVLKKIPGNRKFGLIHTVEMSPKWRKSTDDDPNLKLVLKMFRMYISILNHDDVIKWKHTPRYWSFVWGIYWSPVNSPHKGQWRGALMFSLICARINDSVINREPDDLRRHHAHYDITVMFRPFKVTAIKCNQLYLWCHHKD